MTPKAANELPEFLTVEEAARLLRIGRTAAYALARTWRATDGREGLPVVSFGRLLRVPKAALESMCGSPIPGSTPAPTESDVSSARAADTDARALPDLQRPAHTRRRTRHTALDQAHLPFAD